MIDEGAPSPLPAAILLMGVSGCGKTTTGESLAAELGWSFRDADSFHPPANIAKMRSGVPLTDADRWPWLAAIGTWLDERLDKGEPGIVSCSALKRIYRRFLLDSRPRVRLVYLKGEMPLIAGRMARRANHFMPPALLKSQFETLEEPTLDEWPIIVPVDTSPRRVVEHILADMANLGRHWREG
jgi:gluconokinase